MELAQLANADLIFSILYRRLYRSGKTLAANTGGRGFESHRGQNLFFTIYSIYRVECEKLFCKTNIKLKRIKIN